MMLAAAKIRVKVLSVASILDFRGDAYVAGVRPRFVVSLILEGGNGVFRDEPSDVEFTTHTTAVFAIDSVTKLFADKDVVGRTFDLYIRSEVIAGVRRFFLSLY
jgi:hypothetical protein